MPDKFRKRVILFKRETVYGTDSVPTGAANAIQISEANVTPLAGDDIDRGILYPSLGASPDLLAGHHVQCEFAVEIAGAGAPVDTIPGYGALLRACGMSETVNAGVSVAYDPVSSGEDSGTGYFHMDATLHKFLGARGNCRLEFPARAVPHFMFSLLGLWVAPAGAALPTAVFAGFKTPRTVSKANTPTFTIDGYAAVMRSLTLDMGNQVVHRDLVNSEVVHRPDRQATGTLVIEAPALATKDFFALAKAETLVALQLIHGVGAGNIVQVDAPKVQLKRPSYSEDEGIVMLNLPLKFTRNAGDDEFKITVK